MKILTWLKENFCFDGLERLFGLRVIGEVIDLRSVHYAHRQITLISIRVNNGTVYRGAFPELQSSVRKGDKLNVLLGEKNLHTEEMLTKRTRLDGTIIYDRERLEWPEIKDYIILKAE